MKIYIDNDFKKNTITMRCMELLPSFSIVFHKNWRFESIRLSWLGFIIALYRD